MGTWAPYHSLSPLSHHKKVDPNKSSPVVNTFPSVTQLSLLRIQSLPKGIKLASLTLADWALLQVTDTKPFLSSTSPADVNWPGSFHYSQISALTSIYIHHKTISLTSVIQVRFPWPESLQVHIRTMRRVYFLLLIWSSTQSEGREGGECSRREDEYLCVHLRWS